jgi:adenosylcobinamide kinase/adenosylcobinamide-phosphate guanylyltransferase
MADLARSTFVIGGARSGKSRYAEGLFEGRDNLIYVATAEERDSEMAQRVIEHQDRRGPAWSTIEEPVDLIGALDRAATRGAAILVDCLSLWLSNLMERERDVAEMSMGLVNWIIQAPVPVVLVSNEVGLGIVPASQLGRAYRDAAGRLNQSVAAAAERVVFIAAGLPLTLK